MMKRILLALALSIPVLSQPVYAKRHSTEVKECHSIPNKTSMYVKFDSDERTVGYGKRTFQYSKSADVGDGVIVNIYRNKYEEKEFFMTLDNPKLRDKILFIIRTELQETDAGFCDR